MLSVLVIIGLSVVTFLIARVVPSDPAARYAGPKATVEQIAAAKQELGLDKPLLVQYVRYMAGVLRGDLGISITTHNKVAQDIRGTLPPSLELIVLGMLIALAAGIPVGVLGAMKPGSWIDGFGRLAAVVLVSFPSFCLGFVLQLLLYDRLHLLPVSGRVSNLTMVLHPVEARTGFYLIDSALAGNWSFFGDALSHLLLPALTLAAYPFGLVVRMVRASMVEVLAQDHTRLLKALGMKLPKIAFRYAFKLTLPALLTVIALSFAYSLTGTFLIESVFGWPGMGDYVSKALITNDYPAVMGTTLLIGIVYIGLNLIVDLGIAFVDPRVRWS